METLYVAGPVPTLSEISASYEDILAHPERYYQGFDIVWMMISSALVFLMIPALSLIYAGIGNRSFALTLFRLPLMTGAFIGFQWVIWGYSLTFTRSRPNLPLNWWGGETRAIGLFDVLARPIGTGDGVDGPSIPELVYVLYEGMFASFTAALVCGGTMHRARPGRFLIFISMWAILVYDPVARWSWDSDGWSSKLGTMDFAGGTPVHIVSGTTVAAFAVFSAIEARQDSADFRRAVRSFLSRIARRIWRVFRGTWRMCRSLFDLLRAYLGGHVDNPGDLQPEDEPPRRGPAPEPYNVNYLALGTALLWFGWAGFNGGSALGGNMRAVSAWTATHFAACAGGTVGVLLIWNQKFWSSLGDSTGQRHAFRSLTVISFCDGAIAGLVAITPGAGYVSVWSATIFGAVSAFFVHFLKKETHTFLQDDPLQVFAVHTGGGFVGMFLTGIFADATTIGLDGHSKIPNPGFTIGKRVGYQMIDAFAGIGYTFFVTLAILYFMKIIFYLFGLCFTDDKKSWWAVTGSEEQYTLEDVLQATSAQGPRDAIAAPQFPIITLARNPASEATPPPSDHGVM